MVLAAPKVSNRHQIYGPTLAPEDRYVESQVQIGRGVTVGVHNFSQLMHDIADVETAWEQVCGVNAASILHRSVEVARAAKRLPAHRLEPHSAFSSGVFWQCIALHPAASPPSEASVVVVWLVYCSQYHSSTVGLERL